MFLIKQQWSISLLFVFVLLSVICLLLGFYFYYPIVGYDSGYYMATAEALYHGNKYFTEIASPYNPLAIAILGLPKLWSPSQNFSIQLCINILFMIGSCILMYRILQPLISDKRWHLIFVLLFFALSLVYDGSHLMLEPIAVFFQLLALSSFLQFQKTNKQKFLLWAGIFVSMGFLAKQYALFILPPIIVAIFLSKQQRLRNYALLTFGLAAPIALLYLYYAQEALPFPKFLQYISGQGMDFDQGIGTGKDYTIHFRPIRHFLFMNAYIVWGLLLLIRNFKMLQRQDYFYLSFPISACSILLFAAYDHYFQMIIPYTIIATACIYGIKQSQVWKSLLTLSIIIGFGRMLYVKTPKVMSRIARSSQQLEDQNQLATAIQPGRQVYLDGPSPGFYGLNQFQSIALDRIGFSFPGYFKPKTIVEHTKIGSTIIISKQRLASYEGLLGAFERSDLVLEGQTVWLYKRIHKDHPKF